MIFKLQTYIVTFEFSKILEKIFHNRMMSFIHSFRRKTFCMKVNMGLEKYA